MSEEKLSPVMREIAPQAEQIFRDQYVLEFIGGKDYEHENTMKKALINRMKDFVLEFGKDFLFIDEEYRLHQKGIYADGELDENATRKKFFLVRQEGRVPGCGYCACHK